MPSDNKDKPIPEEKWADEVRIHSRDQAEIDRIAAVLADGLDDYLDISDVELDHTEDEDRLIDEVVTAHNCFRLGLKLEPIGFSRRRFHFLTEKDWEARVEPHLPGSGAMAAYGHCYLRRQTRRRMAMDLTHELAHAASFLTVDVVPIVGVKPRLMLRRSGLAVYQYVDDRTDFSGLNEAVTEIAALRQRNILAKTSTVLTEAERESIFGRVLYYPHVRLMIDLIAETAPAEGGVDQTVRRLFLDYMTGTFDFLRRLSRIPGRHRSVLILREMGTEDEAPLVAAEKLGLTDCVRDLRAMLGKEMP